MGLRKLRIDTAHPSKEQTEAGTAPMRALDRHNTNVISPKTFISLWGTLLHLGQLETPPRESLHPRPVGSGKAGTHGRGFRKSLHPRGVGSGKA